MTRPDPIPSRPDVPGTTRTGGLATAVLVLAPAAAFVVPFIGPLLAAVLTIVLGAVMGDLVWPVRKRIAVLAAIAVVGAIVLVVGVLGIAVDMGNVVGFQLVPLCAPTPGSVWFLAAAVGVVGYGVVAGASVRLHAIWLWPIAATAGAGLYLATWAIVENALDVRWIC